MLPRKTRPNADELARQIISKPKARILDFVSDPRRLHTKIMPANTPHRGQFRQPGPCPNVSVTTRFRSGTTATNYGAEVDVIAEQMRELREDMRGLLSSPPPAEDVPEALSEYLGRFFTIHPFVDGNGRTGRMIVYLAAHLLGRPVTPDWTIEQRPYGRGFAFAFLAFGSTPEPLTHYMQRYFRHETPTEAPS